MSPHYVTTLWCLCSSLVFLYARFKQKHGLTHIHLHLLQSELDQYFSHIYQHFPFKYIQENSWKISGGFAKTLRSFICEDVRKLLRWRIKKYWSLFIKSWYPQLILFYTWANLFYKNYIIAPKVEPIESSCVLFAKKICVNFDMHSNSIEITLRHECSSVNLLHILRTLFPNNTSGRLLLFLLYSTFWKKGRAK